MSELVTHLSYTCYIWAVTVSDTSCDQWHNRMPAVVGCHANLTIWCGRFWAAENCRKVSNGNSAPKPSQNCSPIRPVNVQRSEVKDLQKITTTTWTKPVAGVAPKTSLFWRSASKLHKTCTTSLDAFRNVVFLHDECQGKMVFVTEFSYYHLLLQISNLARLR